MLKTLLFFNAVCFGLSIPSLVLLGHRIKRGHWLFSLGYFAALSYASCRILQVFAIPLPPPVLILTEFLIGAGIIALNRDWNPMGHATFWSLGMTVVNFLIFASYATFFSDLNPWGLVLSSLLLLLQAFSMCMIIAHTYEILDVVCRVRWRRVVQPKPTTDYFPKVSIHVPAHNEPPEMVKATLSALARLDYPNYEVILIDDNTDDEKLWRPVQVHCRKLGFKFFHLENWPGYKSGALNFALGKTDPKAEIVGVVDSDYVVEPHYLRDLVGLFRNPRVAFVQTPQDYLETERKHLYGQACYDAYLYFFRISMATRNEHNGIIYAGTMGLISRQILENVGGWDEWCITEDAELSLRILHEGYQGLYVDRTYGRGLMPLDWDGLRKQRFRWAFGGMQILRMHARKLLPRWAGGDPNSRLTWSQKFGYLSGGLQWLNDPLTFVYTVLLFIGVGALNWFGSLPILPAIGTVMFIPTTFILFGLLRFIWALRIRLRCSVGDAYRALTILLGLTWVVTLACVQGLTRKQGVFLRTPKNKGAGGLHSGLRTLRWELVLAATCAGALLSLLTEDVALLPRMLIMVVLTWHVFIYSSAAQAWLWSYQRDNAKASSPRLTPLGRSWAKMEISIHTRTAIHLAIGALLAAQILGLWPDLLPGWNGTQALATLAPFALLW